jgi:hypothetical protein
MSVVSVMTVQEHTLSFVTGLHKSIRARAFQVTLLALNHTSNKRSVTPLPLLDVPPGTLHPVTYLTTWPPGLALLPIGISFWEINVSRTHVRSRKGSAMAQAASRRPLTEEARLRSPVIPCGICGGQSGTRTGFSPSTSVVNFNPPVLHYTEKRKN